MNVEDCDQVETVITSREIAELVGSRHSAVKAAIERIAERKLIVQPPMADEPGSDAMGQPRVTRVYRFFGESGVRDGFVVAALLSPQFTVRLVERWQELDTRERAQQARVAAHEQRERRVTVRAIDLGRHRCTAKIATGNRCARPALARENRCAQHLKSRAPKFTTRDQERVMAEVRRQGEIEAGRARHARARRSQVEP